MRDGIRSVAGWVWALTGLLPIGAGAGAAVLYTDGTRSVSDTDYWSGSELGLWIIAAAVIIAASGLINVPTFTANPLTPAYIAVASLPLLITAVGPLVDAETGAVVTGGSNEPVIVFDRVFHFPAAMAAVLGGLAALWVMRAATGEDPRTATDRFIRRLAVFSVYLAMFDVVDGSTILEGSEWKPLAAFFSAAVAAFVVEVVLDAVLTGRMLRRRVRGAFPSAAADVAVFVSLMATGALFALAFEAIGAWAVAVAVLPYGFAAGAFRRLAQTKRTYEQTLVALAQIPEAGGHTEPGHAARTNELSLAVADRIGVSPGEWEQVNYASYLHDIGRITLNEPSILRQGFTEVDIAQWGAEIVGETSYLSEVAEIVRRQHEPFRSPGEQYNPDLPLASRIIKVCSAYDEAVTELGLSPLDAVEQIYKGTTYDYDPEIVNTLRTVLERRGAFNHPARVSDAGR